MLDVDAQSLLSSAIEEAKLGLAEAPCRYCSGLVVQFGIGAVIVGESKTFQGGISWLRERGIEVIDLDSTECHDLLQSYITAHPDIWNEDIGEPVSPTI